MTPRPDASAEFHRITESAVTRVQPTERLPGLTRHQRSRQRHRENVVLGVVLPLVDVVFRGKANTARTPRGHGCSHIHDARGVIPPHVHRAHHRSARSLSGCRFEPLECLGCGRGVIVEQPQQLVFSVRGVFGEHPLHPLGERRRGRPRHLGLEGGRHVWGIGVR